MNRWVLTIKSGTEATSYHRAGEIECTIDQDIDGRVVPHRADRTEPFDVCSHGDRIDDEEHEKQCETPTLGDSRPVDED